MKISILSLLFIVSIISSFSVYGADCEFTFSIVKNDSVKLLNALALPHAESVLSEGSAYRVVFTDQSGKILLNESILVVFAIADIGSTEKTVSYFTTECNPNWNDMDMYHDASIIYHQDISHLFCDYNGVCDGKENYYSCKDCPSGSNDGICDLEQDGKCDLDCTLGDRDCRTLYNLRVTRIFSVKSLIVFAVLLVLLFIVTMIPPYFLKRRR